MIDEYGGSVPNRSQTPTDFNANVQNYLSWLANLAPQINNTINEILAMANVRIYNSAKIYNMPDTVYGDDGGTYRCLGTNVIGEDPIVNEHDNWGKLSLTQSDLLEQEKGLYPIGAPIPWLSDSLPTDYAFMQGQSFDLALYPLLALVYPDGVIPDMRGLGLIGKETSEDVGVMLGGEGISHAHAGTIANKDLGTKATSSDAHSHKYLASTRGTKENAANSTTGFNLMYNDGTTYNTTGDTHAHSVALGSHNHTVTIEGTGGIKNTIDRRLCNFIVRMA